MRTLIIFVAVATLVPPCMSQHHGASPRSFPPRTAEVEGWSRADSARIYVGTDLYRFIDGGADLFFEYGFRRAAATEYRNGEGASINCELFEMSDPDAGFGVYSIRSGEDGNPIAIGNGGLAHPHYLMFWKGRYYISVAASDSTAECRKGMEALARAVDRGLVAMGGVPRVVELLPKEGLRRQRFVRGQLGLSSMRLPEISGMPSFVDGVVGTYANYTTVILRYRNALESEQHLTGINSSLRSDSRFTGVRMQDAITMGTDRNHTDICLGLSGQYMVLTVSPEGVGCEAACRKVISLLMRQ
jgi:hypothetical protein